MHRFAISWSGKDVDGCMACFSEVAVFAASAGPEPGTTYAGKAAIRPKLQEIFDDPANAPLVSGRFFTMGQTGMMEWSRWTGRCRMVRSKPSGASIFTNSAAA